MGESVKAVTLPGSTKLSTGAPGLGGATITVGAAISLVRSASTVSADLRLQNAIARQQRGDQQQNHHAEQRPARRNRLLLRRGTSSWLRQAGGFGFGFVAS